MDIGTDGVDTGTSTAISKASVPNQVIAKLRADKGWGRGRLALEFDRFCTLKGWSSPGEPNISKQIYRLETGKTRRPDEFYARLYCEYFGKSPQELFGDTSAPCAGSRCELTSHKFVPAFVGAEAARLLVEKLDMEASSSQWLPCSVVPLEHSDGNCVLYVFPFGVAMFHLVETRTFDSVAELAVWRRVSYVENREWAAGKLWDLLGSAAAEPSYVLSMYFVREPCWSDLQLDTALRLMCVPRVLLEREAEPAPASLARAELVEQSLLREGFEHAEVVEFGIKGVAKGFASWSGVVYYPVAESRALSEDELVRCELSVQAVWAYCDYIRNEVEQGLDPLVDDEYGWRFLRGVRSRLTTERPRESSQHRSMREAIIETSGLARHLTHAVETLREANGGVR